MGIRIKRAVVTAVCRCFFYFAVFVTIVRVTYIQLATKINPAVIEISAEIIVVSSLIRFSFCIYNTPLPRTFQQIISPAIVAYTTPCVKNVAFTTAKGETVKKETPGGFETPPLFIRSLIGTPIIPHRLTKGGAVYFPLPGI